MANDKANYVGKIPVFDIYCAAYLEFNNIPSELILQGTRVIFEFPAKDRVYEMLREYQGNPSISLLDYINILRRLRSRMLSKRG